MIEVTFSSSFKRAFRKRIKGQSALEDVFWERVAAFEKRAVFVDIGRHDEVY